MSKIGFDNIREIRSSEFDTTLTDNSTGSLQIMMVKIMISSKVKVKT